MSFLRNILGTLLALLLLAFALQNRSTVPITYSPIDEAITVPLYAVVLSVFIFGFLLGGFMVWVNTAPERRTSRHQRKAFKALEKELAGIKDRPAPIKNPASELFPALPPR